MRTSGSFMNIFIGSWCFWNNQNPDNSFILNFFIIKNKHNPHMIGSPDSEIFELLKPTVINKLKYPP